MDGTAFDTRLNKTTSLRQRDKYSTSTHFSFAEEKRSGIFVPTKNQKAWRPTRYLPTLRYHVRYKTCKQVSLTFPGQVALPAPHLGLAK